MSLYILYTYIINRHAETPKKTSTNKNIVNTMFLFVEVVHLQPKPTKNNVVHKSLLIVDRIIVIIYDRLDDAFRFFLNSSSSAVAPYSNIRGQ